MDKMCRENCREVTGTFVYLSLGQIFDVPQAGSREIRVREDGAAKIGMIEDCVA
jgi:hypothetical protein